MGSDSPRAARVAFEYPAYRFWMAARFLTTTASEMQAVAVAWQVYGLTLGTPDEMRGRVSAVNMIFIGASNEVGQFESGLTAQWFGAVPAVVLGGLATLGIVAAWAYLFPALRRADGLHPAPAETAEVAAE